MSDNEKQENSQDPSEDIYRTQIGAAPSIQVTQTIKPVQCPVCKTFNAAGEAFCVECGLLFSSALPEDAFGAPAVKLPCLVEENGREHFLQPGKNLVGREGDVFLSDGRVSRKHAEIIFENNTLILKDLGSTNGTFVNGEKLEPNVPRQLKHGDKVEFGGVPLTVQFPEEMSEEVPPPLQTQTIESPLRGEEPPVAFLVSGENEFPIRAGVNTIGRRSENDIVISDPYVSGLHGKIEVKGEEVWFTDVGSTNGSFLNGSKIPPHEPVRIRPEDELQLGSSVFRVRFAEKEKSEISE
ncbi:MAG TPA: FHA domain-containing protein [Fimbriimonadales bacterium]|nr:FHA domain-containing protein [Fimbriimonadales bacterium]